MGERIVTICVNLFAQNSSCGVRNGSVSCLGIGLLHGILSVWYGTPAFFRDIARSRMTLLRLPGKSKQAMSVTPRSGASLRSVDFR